MVNTTYNSTQEMIHKLPSLNSQTKLKFHLNIINYFVEMNYRRQSGYYNLMKIFLVEMLKVLARFLMKYFCY